VAKDTDCATEYVIRFQVENPKVQQDNVPVSIKAEWISDTRWTFTDSVGIASSAMVKDDSHTHLSDIEYAVQGDAHALTVRALEFKTTLAEQSTPYPCDVNQIRLTFKTNVPLLKTERCSPTLTITGLDNAIAPTGFINITQDSWFAATASKFEGYVYPGDTYRGSWNNAATSKTLKLSITSSTMAATDYSFNITVRNPAEGQSCPTTSITARDCGDVCTDPSTTNTEGCSSPRVISQGGLTGQQGNPSALTKSAGDVCAMQITAFQWNTKQVTQSSPFPCDNNTITVELRPNVPVRLDCMPSFTIHGFGAVQAPMAGNMTLADVGSSSAVGVGQGFGTYAVWGGPGTTGGSGKLELELKGLLLMNVTYRFSFEVTNLGIHQNAQVISITTQMSNQGLGFAGSKDTMARSQQPMTTTDATAELIISDRSIAGMTFSSQDMHPLFVKSVQLLLVNISQSTSIPCADNTITVALKSNVPLLVTPKPDCQPQITIKGITETNTADTAVLALSDSSNVIAENGTWTRSAGELVFNVGGPSIFQAGSVYTFTFVVENPARGQPAPNVETRVSGLGTTTDFEQMQGHHSSAPLYVQTASIINAGATQTSDTPCEESVITISLEMTVQLLSKCHPTLTITGLANSLSDSTTVAATPDIFPMVSWSRSAGRLVVNSSSTVDAASQISFTFTLRNPNFGQERQPFTIQGNIWNAMDQTWGKYEFSGNVNSSHPAPLKVAQLTMQSKLGQWSPYPCDANSLTVTISTNRNLKAYCNPVITVYNLQNAYNPAGNLSLEAGSAAEFRPYGVWSSDNRLHYTSKTGNPWQDSTQDTFGKFVIDVAADLTAGTDYVFEFNVTNPARPQASPAVVVELNGIYPGYVTVQTTYPTLETTRIKQLMMKDMYNSPNMYNPCYLNKYGSFCNWLGWWSKEGTASPLYIRKAAFEVGQQDTHIDQSNKAANGSAAITFVSNSIAGQSSYYPCELNTITVTVQTNVPLLSNCRPTFTITGLNTDRTTFLKLPITNAAGHFHTTGSYSLTGSTYANKLPSQVSTEADKGKLVVTVNVSTVAGTQYVFSFPLNNTNLHQHAPSLSISAEIHSGTSLPGTFELAPIELPGDATDGSKKKPLFVIDNYWKTREIEQSNPLPCAMNNITVFLATSVPLHTVCSPIEITIRGIDQTVTDDNVAMEVHDCSSGAKVFAITGDWKRGQGALKVKLVADTFQDQIYCLRFLVKNKAEGSTSIAPHAEISGVPLTGEDTLGDVKNFTTALVDSNPIWTEFVCPSINTLGTTYWSNSPGKDSSSATGTFGQTFKIGKIPHSTFDIKVANQSNAFPCHHNTILFELRPNVKLLPGTAITIEGLYAKDKNNAKVVTQTVSTDAMMLGGHHASTFNSNGVWTNDVGKLELVVAPDQHLAACQSYFFSISVINPTDDSPHDQSDCTLATSSKRLFDPATITVTAKDICIAQETINNDVTSSPRHYGATAGDAAPLAVLMPVWVTTEIGQSTPYPYSRNTITVTLKSNVPLVSYCPRPVRIEISGLDDRSTQRNGKWNRYKYATSTTTSSTDFAASFGPAAVQSVTYTSGTLDKTDFLSAWENSEAYREGVGMWPDNSGDIMISPLQSICVAPTNDTFSDHEYFQNKAGSAGEPGIASWNSYIDDWASGAIAGTRTLTVYPAITTNPEEDYIFSFQIVNPVIPQESPEVSIKSSGVCMNKKAMTKDNGKPCCTSCTHTGDAMTGDAAPLRVMDSFFCIKTIHQSTPNPCELNTLTVTMMANVPFKAGRTQILISKLTNADFPLGEIQIEDGSMGANHHLMFANTFFGTPGTGLWGDTDDSLRLWVVKDTEAGSEYVIRFKIYNPPNAQDPAQPTIKAEDVGNSKDIWSEGYDIIPRTMDYPKTTGGNELDDPMKVIATTFNYIDVASSSIFPCDNRTITITFETNVPVWKRCKPIWTFTGFQEAYAHIGGLVFGVHGDNDYIQLGGPAASSFAPVRTDDITAQIGIDFDTDARAYAAPWNRHNDSIAGYGSWTNYRVSANDQRAVNPEVRKLRLFVNETLAAGMHHSFSFTVVNPAKNQAATAVSMEAVGQPMAKELVFDTMDVLESKFTVKNISQSSPWPCDENTITLDLVSNSPLFRRCQSHAAGNAGVTIKGLIGTMAPTTERDYIPVVFVDNRLGAYNATWNGASGILTIRVIDILQQSGLQSVNDLSMSFLVVNKATGQDSPSIELTHRITNVVEEGGEGTAVLTEVMFKRPSPISLQATDSLLPSVGSTTKNSGDGDGEPMRIRSASFLVKNIIQSSPYPCDDNNIIHVTLMNSVPLISGYCVHDITIKGLKHYWTPDNKQMDLTEGDFSGASKADVDAVFGWGEWDQSKGWLTMNVTEGQIMVAGKIYVLSMKMHNPQEARNRFVDTDESGACGDASQN